MPKAKKTKKEDDWMGFYSGRIPKKIVPKKTVKKKPKKTVHTCHYCSNKSDEGSGEFRPDVDGGSWVCSPCIESEGLDEKLAQLEPKGGVFATMPDDDDDDNDNGVFQKLSPLEIIEKRERDKNKNFWLLIFGVIIIAIILSLVERSRIFSVIAVVALIAVFLLYKYEVKI